jgi:hypothetical protein
MSRYRHELFVHSSGPRPPFGSVVAHVYGPGANVDTDGDSYPALSAAWTWLHMQSRPTLNAPVVKIMMLDETATVMRVASDDLALATKAARFLAEQTGGKLGEAVSRS